LRLGKERKYLLITWSFPHFPQFFPQVFSTASRGCGKTGLINIKIKPEKSGLSTFSGIVVFTHGEIIVQKFILDREVETQMQNSECRMQNEGISFGNNLNHGRKPIQQFCILRFAFCITELKNQSNCYLKNF